MKSEQEVIRMKARIQKFRRMMSRGEYINPDGEIVTDDGGLAGYEQALHWVLMPTLEDPHHPKG